MEQRKCSNMACGAMFEPRSNREGKAAQRFCCRQCRYEFRQTATYTGEKIIRSFLLYGAPMEEVARRLVTIKQQYQRHMDGADTGRTES